MPCDPKLASDNQPRSPVGPGRDRHGVGRVLDQVAALRSRRIGVFGPGTRGRSSHRRCRTDARYCKHTVRAAAVATRTPADNRGSSYIVYPPPLGVVEEGGKSVSCNPSRSCRRGQSPRTGSCCRAGGHFNACRWHWWRWAAGYEGDPRPAPVILPSSSPFTLPPSSSHDVSSGASWSASPARNSRPDRAHAVAADFKLLDEDLAPFVSHARLFAVGWAC